MSAANDDTELLDFLADREQTIANVLLPADIVKAHPDSLRDAIRTAKRRWESEQQQKSEASHG